MQEGALVFETERLVVRTVRGCDEDVAHLLALWSDPEVMANVGFPRGLGITEPEIRAGVRRQPESEYDRWLVVWERSSEHPIGECKLGSPDLDGVCGTDVKLRPAFWRKGYGTEIKQALLDYLFTHTDCHAVRATPNKQNLASQRMQEAVGGRCIGEGCFEPAPEQRDHMTRVPYYLYEVSRSDWSARRS